MKFRHVLSRVCPGSFSSSSFFAFINARGIQPFRRVAAPDAEKAKEIAKRDDEPLFTGDEGKNKLWAFYAKSRS